MGDIIQCCPVCGMQLTYRNIKCPCCQYSKHVDRHTRKELKELIKRGEASDMPIALYNSLHPKQYYENISQEQYNTKNRWMDVFVKQELSKNPLFDIVMYYASCQKQDGNWFHKNFSQKSEKFNNVQTTSTNIVCPKCPTCNSTNIEKISIMRRGFHAMTWGLFSKTARSQFECKNCGYKW